MEWNVDSFEVTWDTTHITLAFLDIFDTGESYAFLPEDAAQIRDALTYALTEQAKEVTP